MLVNYNYKTLPHNRGAKANNSVVRFSNEAEFITQTSIFNSPDIRYTAQGCYPYGDGQNSFPSPPEAYKSVTIMDNSVTLLPTVTLLNNHCAVQQDQKWPSILPGYQNNRYLQSHEIGENNVIHEVEEDEGEECDDRSNKSSKCRQLTKPVADSPDEGYGGDTQEILDA
jgi:hypothetical protein